MLVNGVQLDVTEVRTMVMYQQPTLPPPLSQDLETGIVGTIQKQMYSIQQAIYTVSTLTKFRFQFTDVFFQNKLNDQMNVYDYLLNKSNVLERLNKHVVTKGKQLDLSGRGMQYVAAKGCGVIVSNFCSSGREGWRSV